jgi:hypothetical protein
MLRARLSEGGGDSDVSDADSFARVVFRDLEFLEDVLDSCDLDTAVVRDAVREGALGLLASIEACERLRVGMWISRWGDNWQAYVWSNGRRGLGVNKGRRRCGVWVRREGGQGELKVKRHRLHTSVNLTSPPVLITCPSLPQRVASRASPIDLVYQIQFVSSLRYV